MDHHASTVPKIAPTISDVGRYLKEGHDKSLYIGQPRLESGP